MAESNRSPISPPFAGLLPVAALFGGLFVVWCLSVVWLRQLGAGEGWARQAYPLLLWLAAIALWVAWQRPRRPAEWVGLVPVGPRALAIAAAAFAAVFGWHAIRIALGRMPGGLLFLLPAEIYAWMLSGIFVNELLFHGILQTRLTEQIGPRAAIVLTAVAVLLFRVPSFYIAGAPVEPVMLSSIFLLSLLAGILRHVSGSLWPAIALQAGNALGSLL